jgi:hypothetical protein
MLGEAPHEARRSASAQPSRSSSEPQNGDGGIVLRCPQPVKQKSARRKKRDEQKKQVASSAAAAESPSIPADIVPAVPAAVKTEDACRSSGGKEDEQSGSNEDARESTGDDDDPDLSMRAGLIVNRVSTHSLMAALNDDVPSQWPYTALSEIRDKALMSVIGVVSAVAKEPTRASSGGTNRTSRTLWSLTICHFFRLVHLFLATGSFRA